MIAITHHLFMKVTAAYEVIGAHLTAKIKSFKLILKIHTHFLEVC